MSYFDFLQDQETEIAPKRVKPVPPGGEESLAKEKGTEGHVLKRSEASKKVTEAVERLISDIDRQDKVAGAELKNRIKSGQMQIGGDPSQAARNIERELKTLSVGNTTFTNALKGDAFRGLARAVTDYNLLLQEPDEQALQGQLRAQDQPALKQSVEAGRKNASDIEKRYLAASTDEEKDTYARQLKDAREIQGQIESRLPKEVAPQPKLQSPNQTLGSVFTDHLADEEEMRTKVIQGLSILQAVNPAITFSSPVASPYIAIATVAKALGPQAVQSVFGRMVQDIEGKPTAPEREAKKADERAQELDRNVEVQLERRKQVYQDLVNSGGLNSFGSVLVFVLTSMLIGPKLAALFFVNKAKQGQLQGELDSIDFQINRDMDRAEREERMAQDLRSRAMLQKEDHRQELQRDALRHFQRIAEAMMRHPKGDKEGDYLISRWRQNTAMFQALSDKPGKERLADQMLQRAEDSMLIYERWLKMKGYGQESAGEDEAPRGTE